jgi:hypothetical protein
MRRRASTASPVSDQNAVQSLQFAGDQINTIETQLGALVTVFIRRTIDAGSTTFTLLVPRVNLRFGDFAPITTPDSPPSASFQSSVFQTDRRISTIRMCSGATPL